MPESTRSWFGIFIAAGGTGGHIFPALAVWDEIHRQHPNVQILWIGSSHRMESNLIPSKGIEFVGIKQTELRRRPSLRNIFYNIRSVGYAFSGLFQTIAQLRKLKPRLVLTTGGFVGGSTGLASWITRTPLAIIEPNAYPGLTNRMLEKFARMVFVTYPESMKYFRSNKTYVTGTPSRREVAERDRTDARKSLGIPDDTLLVLVIGGSQGADGINKVMPEAARLSIKDRPDLKFQVIHQCGMGKLGSVKVDRSSIDDNRYRVVEFIEDTPTYLAASDITISRAGASSLAEIASRCLPSILVPYPFSSENHQVKNARSWEEAGAAVCLEEKNLNASGLATSLLLLLTDRSKREAMGNCASRFGNPKAAEVIAHMLESIISY
jgi:UDP-N-acetylglucosamine--N-acetylmuramyl-(pentapeptide) pyrophosphoryl-undecaprenol N-acetylglucosamine transferase